MAAKPIERFVKKQIQDQGGWDRIVERIASGETVLDVSRTILRPDGVAINRSFLSRLLHQDPERSAKVFDARKEGASAMVDDALSLVDRAPADRDSVNKAKAQAELRVKVAGFIDRENWGEKPSQINVTVNQAELHINALRHRMVEASRPLEQAIADGQRADFVLTAGADGSPANDESDVSHTRGTGECSLTSPDPSVSQ